MKTIVTLRAILALGGALVGLVPIQQAEAGGTNSARVLATLPVRPTVISGEALRELHATAADASFDGALILISALVYNLDPGVSNEKKSLAEMIPSIGLLRTHYGKRVVPLLVYECLAGSNPTIRERAAYAISCLGTPGEVKQWRKEYALATSTNPLAGELERALQAGPSARLKLASAAEAEGEQLDAQLKKLGIRK